MQLTSAKNALNPEILFQSFVAFIELPSLPQLLLDLTPIKLIRSIVTALASALWIIDRQRPGVETNMLALAEPQQSTCMIRVQT